jgi:hypothetical protein
MNQLCYVVRAACVCLPLLRSGFVLAGSLATDGAVTLEFSTIAMQAKHSPKHVLAVWVADARTNYVKTIARHASKRAKYLAEWNKARGQDAKVDGTTGATLPQHGQRTVSWNCRDGGNRPVADGEYLLLVEFTSHNKSGPCAVFPFTKGLAPQSKAFEAQKNFSKARLTYTPKRGP